MTPRPVPQVQVASVHGGRQVLASGNWAAVGFFSVIQDISHGTTWFIHRDMDTVVVHLDGHIKKLETELEGCGALFDPPMPGEVWIIPSGTRYRTQAVGGVVHYAELCMDRAVLNRLAGKQLVDRPIRAQAGVFDGFLHRAARRLEELSKAGVSMTSGVKVLLYLPSRRPDFDLSRSRYQIAVSVLSHPLQ
jgi:AraC family transcriptional regulator